jgi:hypothetical protein
MLGGTHIIHRVFAVAALCVSALAQPSPNVERCIQGVTLATIDRSPACLEQVLEEGGAAIDALATRLDLARVQPRVRIDLPPPRLTTTPEGPIDFGFDIRNDTSRPVLVNTRALSVTAEVRFESYGFVWDAGVSSTTYPEVNLGRLPRYLVVEPESSRAISLQVPIALDLVGRYHVTLDLTFDGPLTVPQSPKPEWPARIEHTIEFLPQQLGRSRRLVKSSALRLDARLRQPVFNEGQPLAIEITLRNLTRERIVIPDERSFFAAPLWYIVFERRGDIETIIDHGNVILPTDVRPESDSTQIDVRRLAADQSASITAEIHARVPSNERGYVLLVGYTSFRDPGDQEIWIGEAVSEDLSVTILPRGR